MILAYRRVEGKVDKRKKIVLSQQRGADGEPKLVLFSKKWLIVLILSAREINIPGFPIIGGIDLSRGVCSGFSVTRTRCWVPVVRPLILFDPDSIKIECVHWTRPISSGILSEAYGWFSYKKRYLTISLHDVANSSIIEWLSLLN